MFEHHTHPLLPWPAFVRRLILSTASGMLLVFISLLAGVLGYHYFEQMSWVDAFANAAMILSGMGPLAPLQTFEGKVFAGVYALYSGLALILIAGILFAPVFHRFLHRFHIESDAAENS
ncbi:MAG: hypothetical protein ABIN45_02035 [Gammaproteobacteria bacterium]